MTTLRTLPKIRDSISFLYFDRCKVEQESKAIAIFTKQDKYVIPCASLSTLLLGPGTRITHAAIKTLAENACEVQWVGEDGFRFYSSGRSSSTSVQRLYHQAQTWANPQQRLTIVRKMYQFRFQEELSDQLTLQQIRGLEGVRVRTAYSRLSKATGVEWKGRNYKQDDWFDADPINRALSSANSYLYALCQAAVVSVGYSPALGFIHIGKPLSFIYDIADLYKAETSIPAAFEAVASAREASGMTVRQKCREKFSNYRLMQRIIQDVDKVLGYMSGDTEIPAVSFLWDDQVDWVEGGQDWAEET
ncbi:subtype I-E CRISPR-associated endonuclease Cas1 [Leptolyngbya sp. 'hensonii']|uniref:type I-E CRISPR-associated endonuclease Cas1e n=1 Tax=Leptolyngbya sp. 'hensonii' TaxID=1922337 RepID=UPI00094FB80C|nr:type I-E CRISPR-associated endonuclease Cas1e [Leptolyngbya sp. 'hensonii']OLP18278.1 subtype I-E CRISPR-associated endonuclease Cas1 [Leptolyngbya sp. 'hensonii']